MRFIVILLFFSCVLTLSFSRPSCYESQAKDSELEETEYEGDEEAAADTPSEVDDDEVSNGNGARSNNVEETDESNGDVGEESDNVPRAEERQPRDDSDENFPENKANDDNEAAYDSLEESSDIKNKAQSTTKRRNYNTCLENRDSTGQLESGNLTNHDVYDTIHNSEIHKRGKAYNNAKVEETGSLVFEDNNQNKQIPNEDHKNFGGGQNEESRYYNRRHYETMGNQNKETLVTENYQNSYGNLNRDRRQSHEYNQSTETTTLYSGTSNENSKEENGGEDEESSIKRHIKKLSNQEFEQLLNSLPNDKRTLLKKIMGSDSVDSSDIVGKREITKKAGAVEENNALENIQVDSKYDGESSSVYTGLTDPSALIDGEGKQSDKQSDIQSGTDTVETKTPIDSTNAPSDKVKSLNLEPSKLNGDTAVSVNTNGNSEVVAKIANKRETSVKESGDSITDYNADTSDAKEISNENGYDAFQEEPMTLIDDDPHTHNSNTNTHKRDTLNQEEPDFVDSIKSLEDSFPNPNTYDESDPYSGSDMAPLIRVKRKHETMAVKKRASGVLPDAKVAFIPYKENDDEDNDESNEFDDGGFYDRSSNFEISNLDSKLDKETLSSESRTLDNKFGDRSKYTSSKNKNMENEAMSLGSDTDSVLSGVEGVDDNLMFSNGARNRRADTTDRNNVNSEESRDISLISLNKDQIQKSSSDTINALPYQENEAFGPLMQSNDAELSRYKRIRRVKHIPANEM